MVLQPESYEIAYNVERPTAKAGFMADELFPLYKDNKMSDEDIIKASNKINYYKDKLDNKKIKLLKEKCIPYWDARINYQNSKIPIFLNSKSIEKLNACVSNISNDRQIQEILHPTYFIMNPDSYNEATLLVDVLPLHLKAKLDNFTINYDTNTITLNDLKTTSHYADEFKETSFFKYHYYRQMAFYIWLLKIANEKLFKLNNPTFKSNMLVVSTRDYNCAVFKVTNKDIKDGLDEFGKLINLILDGVAREHKL
jgi:hypothetical protein